MHVVLAHVIAIHMVLDDVTRSGVLQHDSVQPAREPAFAGRPPTCNTNTVTVQFVDQDEGTAGNQRPESGAGQRIQLHAAVHMQMIR